MRRDSEMNYVSKADPNPAPRLAERVLNLKEYKKVFYRYETHLHTKEASACAITLAKDYIKAYKDAGYAGIIVTDHFFNGNTAVPRNLPWKERVKLFCNGYENAAEEGYKENFHVFFGWEAGFCGTEFLIYGLDKEWLLEHDDILSWSVKKQYRMVKEGGGMVIHAHPYREAPYIPEIRLYPDYVDGAEVYNVSNDNLDIMFNKRAYEYAKKYDLSMTGGSDIHSLPPMAGGMEFNYELKSIQDFIDAVKNKKGKVIGLREE